MNPYNYHNPPLPPPRPIMQKYFYTVLFIKSCIYNMKGQAIIFRRKSLQSLMKLINDFDQTYLHTSYEHSYQNKALSQGNVDFLVKYTNNVDSVIRLIDQNSYVIKLSWQPEPIPGPCQQIPIPEPIYPPVRPMPYPPKPVPPPPTPNTIPPSLVPNACTKKVKITKVSENGVVEVRQWDDVKNKYTSMQYEINIGEDSKNWGKGDIAILKGKTLQRINTTSTYRRVKIMDTDKISEDGTIGIADFDDVKMRVTSNIYYISLKPYCYGNKIPDWAKDDDALLIDNKYLIKIDVAKANLATEGDTLPEDLQDEGETTFDLDYTDPDDIGNNGDGNGNNSNLPPSFPPPSFIFYPPCFNKNNPRCYNCSLTASFPQNLQDGMTFKCSCNCCNTNNNNGTTSDDTNNSTDPGTSSDLNGSNQNPDGTTDDQNTGG